MYTMELSEEPLHGAENWGIVHRSHRDTCDVYGEISSDRYFWIGELLKRISVCMMILSGKAVNYRRP